MRVRSVVLVSVALLLGVLSLPPGLRAQDANTIPPVPDPVPVTLNAGSTALLVLDLNNGACPTRPSCVASLTPVARLIAAARAAGVPVVYSSTPAAGGGSAPILPDVAPQPGDPLVVTSANKFDGTNLADILSGLGVDTLVVVGTAANGAVLYTAFPANVRHYTVVVPVDGISSNLPVQTAYVEYQLLNEPGYPNPTNQPLQAGAVTLSRTDLITFSGGK